MNMSPREGLFYAGWMLGIVVCATLNRYFLGFHYLIGLIAGLVLGAGIGVGFQAIYDSLYRKDQLGRGKDGLGKSQVKCPNPGCDWKGNKGEYVWCPKCRSQL